MFFNLLGRREIQEYIWALKITMLNFALEID